MRVAPRAQARVFDTVRVEDPQLLRRSPAARRARHRRRRVDVLARRDVVATADRAAGRVLGADRAPRGPGRPQRVHDRRAQQGQGLHGEGRAGQLRRRGRRRRGQGGAARGHRLPEDAREVRPSRRQAAQGDPAGRPARHRQDAAGARGRGRGRRALLLDQRLRLRRDVRGRRRGARARSLRSGEAESALHHLRRRAGCAGQGAWAGPGDARGARADAEPAAGRAGRLRSARRRDPDGRHQPAGDPGPGVAARRALRSPDPGRPPRQAGAACDPQGARAAGRARGRRRISR